MDTAFPIGAVLSNSIANTAASSANLANAQKRRSASIANMN
jgi:hypothetical protein